MVESLARFASGVGFADMMKSEGLRLTRCMLTLALLVFILNIR